MSVNGASTIFVLTFWIIIVLCNDSKWDSKYWPPLWPKIVFTISLPPPQNLRQWSVHNCWSCILCNQRAIQPCQYISIVLATVLGKNAKDNIATTSWKWVSTERQRFLVLHHGSSKGCAMALTHNQCLSLPYGQKYYWRYHYYLLKMSVNGMWIIFGLASWILWVLWNWVNPWSPYQPSWWAKMLVLISHPPRKNERTCSVNGFCGVSVRYTAKNCIALFLNWVINGESIQFVFVYNVPDMHAMSHISDFSLPVAVESILKKQLRTLL